MIKQLRCNLRDNSIDVKPEWELVQEFTKQTLDRVPAVTPVFMGTKKECGDINLFDRAWDRASAKKPKALKVFEGKTFEESLFDDPIMVDLIEKEVADIYTTDVIAAAIMCSTKSNYSWDIEVKKFGSQIFIDKRQEDDEDDKQQQRNILDYDTVCETSLDHQPSDDQSINGIWPLMKEARQISDSFLHYAHSTDISQTVRLEDENPFIEDENQVATRVGYHYNVWKLQEADEATGQKEKKICIRCSVHSHTGIDKADGESKQTMNIYSMTEHNQDISNWRMRIDTAIIPCINKEIQNNSFKVSRWLIQSMLAQVDVMKFAFVSRKAMDDNKKHVVLATHTVQTTSWAKQLNLQMNEMWSKLRYVVDLIEKDDPASQANEYIMLKDFNKLAFRLYKKDLEEDDEDEDEEN